MKKNAISLCLNVIEFLNRIAFLKSILFLSGKWLCLLLVLAGVVFSIDAQPCQPPDTPSLTATAGPGFKEITFSYVGVQGSNGYYNVFGMPVGGAFGAPLQSRAVIGQSVTYTTNAWGINAYLDTNQTYNFYIQTFSDCGASAQSSVVTVTTFDIQAPTLTATAGPGFEQITFSFVGVPGSEGYYNVFGMPVGGAFGAPIQIRAAAGQTITYTTDAWGINAYLDTNQTYNFYVETWSGTRSRQSGIVTVTTFDIQAPTLTVTQSNNNQANLMWNAVEGATGYVVYSFSTAQNQWNVIANVQPTGGSNLSYTDTLYTPNQTYYYYVTANRRGRRRESNIVSTANYKDQDAGSASCNRQVAEPVNVTNGNMYLQQTDYNLPGVGEALNVTRTYNSIIQFSGLFGYGWATEYDENISVQNSNSLRLALADGRAVYFGRTDSNAPFLTATPDFYGQIVRNADNTYTLTFKDGRVHKFSAGGKLLWQTDRNGNQTTLTYDVNGNLSVITDSFGRTLSVTTNSGYVQQISDSIGTVATYEYFPSTSLLKTVTYADGSKYKFEYTTINSKTYLTTVKDALDNILETHAYDSQGRATTSEKQGGVEKYMLDYSNPAFTNVTDGLGRATKYYFVAGGRSVVTKIEGNCNCGSGSQTTIYQYDAKLNLTKKVDALGREINYTYDNNGNRLSMTDVLGTETYSYNSFGEILTRTDRMNGVTTNTYNATGNLLTTKDALNFTTTLTYDARGQILTVKDAKNNTTTLTYDSFGRLTQVKDANNKMTNFVYDARVRLTSATNAINETTSFEYDLNNRLKKITHPDTTFMNYTYDLAGRRTAMTDERGNTMNYGYDTAYRLISMTDALNHTMTYGYDLMSNPTSQTDALNQTTNYQYDEFNRLKKAIYPPSVVGATRLEERLEYDTVGNVKKRIDTANREMLYDYDTANRLIKTTDALKQITQFEYNPRSQMTKVTDALSQVYNFSYDALGRQLSQTRAAATMSYEYDAVGNRTKRIDYTGRQTSYEYDVLNRLKKINYLLGSGNPTPMNTASYNYDDLSHLTSAVNESGTVSFTYDNRNRIKTTTDVFNHLVEYNYDANSNRTQLKLDSAVHTNYAYDVANRLTQLTDEASQNFTFGYDIANRLISKTLPNSITTTYNYDGMSRLTRLKHQSTTATLTDNQFAYNTANQINQIAELAQTKIFGYDNIDRLTSMNNGTANENYAFDGVGNRTSSSRSSTYGYQPFNRVTSTTNTTMSYDANGNMVSKSEGSNFWHYGWDYENRLTTASTRKQTVRYRYDALGRRVQRYFVRGGNGENTKFIYDGLDVVMDDNSGVLTKYQNGLGIDNKLKLVTNGTAKYFLQDHLGSTVGLADSSGNITSSANYDSFGNSTNNLSTRYQYTGREFDSFTGLHFYRARWYDANLGRFISEDPIGFAGGDVNLFGYVKNSPIRYSDFSGLIGDDAVRNLAPEQFGGGWRGRVDGGISSTEGFEIHVYSPSVNSIGKKAEVGVVSGRLGWIDKHGNPGTRPFGIPDDVLNKLNGLNALEARRYGLIPPKGVAWGINPEGEIVSGNIRGGSYLFPNRTLFNFTGGAIGVLGLIDGLFTDYDTFSRSAECNRSFGEQFKQDNRNYPYLITPLGILKNPSYFPEA